MSDTIVTCVYCGHEYPDGTPTSKSELLTQHIKVCEKHPMRKAESDIRKLREALIGLVGTGDIHELFLMAQTINLTDLPEEDKMVSIKAINVLMETI